MAGCQAATLREMSSTALQVDQATWWTCGMEKLRSDVVDRTEHHVIEGSQIARMVL